jgi:hypothetical protein
MRASRSISARLLVNAFTNEREVNRIRPDRGEAHASGVPMSYLFHFVLLGIQKCRWNHKNGLPELLYRCDHIEYLRHRYEVDFPMKAEVVTVDL